MLLEKFLTVWLLLVFDDFRGTFLTDFLKLVILFFVIGGLKIGRMRLDKMSGAPDVLSSFLLF